MKKFFQRLLRLFGSQNRPSNSVPSGATQELYTDTASEDRYPYTKFAYLATLAKISERFYQGEQFQPLRFPVMDSILGNEDGLVHLSVQDNEASTPQSVVIGRVHGCYGIFEGEIAHTSVNGRHRVNLITNIGRPDNIISVSEFNNGFGKLLTNKILEIFNGHSKEPVIRIIRWGDTKFTPYPVGDFLNRLQEHGFTIETRNRSEEGGCLHPQQRLSEVLYTTDDIFPLGKPYTFDLTR